MSRVGVLEEKRSRRYRNGRGETERLARMNPDRVGEPQWTMALAGVGPAAGDVFGEFRRQVENLTPSYCNLGRLAHYRVRVPTLSGVG
jgi:hypothetical protein